MQNKLARKSNDVNQLAQAILDAAMGEVPETTEKSKVP
jgi:hypothetical protein